MDFGVADFSFFEHFDFGDRGQVQREDFFHADAIGNFPYGEAGAGVIAAARFDNDTFKNLRAFARFTFGGQILNFLMDLDRHAGA